MKEPQSQELSRPPDMEAMEDLLREVKPFPTARFYGLAKNAPWQIKSSVNTIPSRRLANKVWGWGLAATLFILVLLIAVFPPVQAIARQVYQHFLSTSSNQLEVTIAAPNQNDLLDYSDAGYFSSSVGAVQEQVDFPIRQISSSHDTLQLIGARYEASYNAVVLMYQGEGYALFLSERPVEKGMDLFTIGPEAEVRLVRVGESEGEYVVGGWKAIPTPHSHQTPAGADQTTIQAMWDKNLPQFTLRWRQNGISYELRSLGEASPSQSALTSLANELK